MIYSIGKRVSASAVLKLGNGTKYCVLGPY